MAQLDIRESQSALVDAINHLKEKNLFTDENAEAILSPAADEMLSSAKSAFIQSGHNNTKPRRTGKTLSAFMRAKKVYRDKE